MEPDLTEFARLSELLGKANSQVTSEELARKLGAVTQIQSEFATSGAIEKYLGIPNALKSEIAQQFERDKYLLRMATSQSEVVKVYLEQQSGNLAAAKSISHNDSIANEAAKKLVLDQTLSSQAFSQLAIQNEALAAMYRLPEKSEVDRLLESYQIGQVAKFAAMHSIEQKRFAESITSPWIKAAEIGRSFSAILELQGLGNALRSTQGFDPELTAALRFDFGDWRDKINFSKFELLNPVVRTDFYIARGFNAALTDLPEAAFEQSIELAGFNSDILNFESNEENIQTDRNQIEEIGLQRTNRCHDILQRFERKLRQVIDYLMTKQYGSDWPKKKLQPIIYEKWESKRKRAESFGENIPVIELMDFTEYEIIICQKDLWRDIFKNIFHRPESVRESFQRLYPIRLNTMHSRIVTIDDKLYLEVEVHRILREIQKISIQ